MVDSPTTQAGGQGQIGLELVQALYAIQQSITNWLSGLNAGGDLSGTYPDPQVVATHLAAALPIAQGGTGASTAVAALAALGAAALNGSSAENFATALLTATGTGTPSENVLILSDPSASTGVAIQMEGNGATTPLKTVRVRYGNLEVLNSQQTAIILTLDDSGDLTLPGTATAAPGTTGNEVVTYGQVANSAIVPVAAGGTGTSFSASTASFPAPSNGYLEVEAFSDTSGSATPSLSVTASLGSFTGYAVTATGQTASVFAYINISAGQSTTFTATATISSSAVLGVNLRAVFHPTP